MTLDRQPRTLVVALFAATAMFVLSPSCDLCVNTELHEYPSPDGTKKVVVFDRNCGATTGFNTQASIVLKTAQVPTGGGNLFIADSDHGKAPAGPEGGPELRVRWIDNRSVELAHHARARVFKAVSHVGVIRATFVTFQ